MNIGILRGKKEIEQHVRHLTKISSSLFYGSVNHYKSLGLQYTEVPSIVGITGACENVDTLFKIGNRLDLPLFFTQTGQLALEQTLQHVHGAYTIIQSGRDEEFEDERHLRQFVLTEEEFDCTFAGMNRHTYDEEKMFESLLTHIELAIKAMMQSVYDGYGKILSTLYGRDGQVLHEILERPFLRIVYRDAVKLLQRNGFSAVRFGDDLQSEHEAKIVELMNKQTKGYGGMIECWSPVLITRYPKEIKFFNMKVSTLDSRVVLSADCIFPYAGEGVGSAVREHDGEKLKQRLLTSRMFALHESRGGTYNDFIWYVEDIVAKKKTLPHAGYGIGNERVLQFLLGTSDIRTSSLFSMMSKQTNDWDRKKRGYASFYTPKKHVLLSVGKLSNKKNLLPAVSLLKNSSLVLYASDKTHKFFTKHGIETTLVHKINETRKPNIKDLLDQHLFDIVINIPTRSTPWGKEFTDGQFIRNTSVETGTTLITDVRVAEQMLAKLANSSIEEVRPVSNGEIPTNQLEAQNQYRHLSHPGTDEKSFFPTYDISKSYDWNYEYGPRFIGTFPDRLVEAKKRFLSFSVNSCFGIPSGPLLNSRWIDLYAKLGFDILTYKTVRTKSFPAQPMPHMLYVEPEKIGSKRNSVFVGKPYVPNVDSIVMTNSFGVPSKDPDVWQEDVRKSIQLLRTGQILITSVMGTKETNMNQQDFVRDFVTCAVLAKEAGAPVIEVNLSCPNLGEGLVCNDVALSVSICSQIKNAIGNTPLIAKISYLQSDRELREFVAKANEFLDGIAAINTMKKTIKDMQIKTATLRTIKESGICGRSIKPYGISFIQRLSVIKKDLNLKFAILGMGGVSKPEDFEEYIAAGADVVQSATGAMWNPYLAHEVYTREVQQKRTYSLAKSLNVTRFNAITHAMSLDDLRNLYMEMVYPDTLPEEKRTLLIRKEPFRLKNGERGRQYSHVYMNHRNPVFIDAWDRRLLVKIFDTMIKEYVCKKWSKNATYGIIAIPSSSSPELTSSMLDALSESVERSVVLPNYFNEQGDQSKTYGDLNKNKPWILIDDVFTSGGTMKNAQRNLPKWMTDPTGVPRLFGMTLINRNPDSIKRFSEKNGFDLYHLATLEEVLKCHWKKFSVEQKKLVMVERPELT